MPSSSVAAPLVDFQGFRGNGCLCKGPDWKLTTKVSLRSHHQPLFEQLQVEQFSLIYLVIQT